MRQLMLLRHAKSAWDDPALDDRDRPLNARGQLAAAGLRTVMETVGLRPDLVLVSPAVRTVQTLAALTPWPKPAPKVEMIEALYLADVERLMAIVRAIPADCAHVLVIGHNPGLHELAMQLPAPDGPASEDERRLLEGFPTGALAEFAVAAEWAELRAGAGRLRRFVDPRDLAVA